MNLHYQYLPGYLFVCWVTIMLNIGESIAGVFPYRYDYTDGADRVRPGSYTDYAKFRRLQESA